jgi:hypothetical protein
MQKLNHRLLVPALAFAVVSLTFAGRAHADAGDCSDSAYGRVILYTGTNYSGESVNICLTEQINKSADIELANYFFDGPHGRQSIAGNVRSWKAEAKLPYFYGLTFAGQQYYAGQSRKFYACTSHVYNAPSSEQREADGCTQVATMLHLKPSKQN